MDHAKSKSNNSVLQDLNINLQSEISGVFGFKVY